MKTEQTPKHTTICPECGGPADLSWSGLDLVEQTGDETLARKHYKTTAPTLKALNNELLEALEPLNKLADQCLDNSTLDKDQVVYAYNRAQITMSDLRKVRALISKCKDL